MDWYNEVSHIISQGLKNLWKDENELKSASKINLTKNN